MAIMETVKDLSKRSVFSIKLSDSSNVKKELLRGDAPSEGRAAV